MGDLIRDAGSIAAAVAALLGALLVAVKFPPVRWVARHLVGDPVTEAFRREVTEVVEEQLGPIRRDVAAQTTALHAHLDSEMEVQEQIERRLGAIEDRIPPKET